MSVVHTRIRIAAPIAKVWDVVMDPKRLYEWVSIHKSLDAYSQGPPRKGSTMEQTLRIRGVTFHVKWTLVEVNPPFLAEWDGRGPAHSRARTRYELTRDGDDHTVFDYTNEFTTPGGRLGVMASRVFVGGVSEREALTSLQRLKQLVERET
ncbi:MAG TPA: SRPBCC family protein [Solirubrobacteraceae bacterium]|jgi:carbon monoxide dehydrogenase subunit G|nr:SRPBCC family protein [Solirubrobacteraceae bacterium]